MKFPGEPGITVDGETVIVPVPSLATTATVGETARLCRVPPVEDFSVVVKVFVPPLPGVAAPAPPEPVDPYVIVHVCAAVLLTPVTLIVLLATATLPHVD